MSSVSEIFTCARAATMGVVANGGGKKTCRWAEPTPYDPIRQEDGDNGLDHLWQQDRPRGEAKDPRRQRLHHEGAGQFVERDRRCRVVPAYKNGRQLSDMLFTAGA